MDLQAIKQRYEIVGNCEGLNHVLNVALQVAPTMLSVLIVGESGVGKEIIPRVIHDNRRGAVRNISPSTAARFPRGRSTQSSSDM